MVKLNRDHQMPEMEWFLTFYDSDETTKSISFFSLIESNEFFQYHFVPLKWIPCILRLHPTVIYTMALLYLLIFTNILSV